MTETVEIWEPIPGHEENYEASNMGRVRCRDGISQVRTVHSLVCEAFISGYNTAKDASRAVEHIREMHLDT